METNKQGTLAEISVVKRLLLEGFDVFLPIGGKSTHDLLAYRSDTGVICLQVKSTAHKTPSGSYGVQLKSVRPNRSKSVIHRFDNKAQDMLAIYIVEIDAVIFLLSSAIKVSSQLSIKPLDAITLSELSISEILESKAAGVAGDVS